MNLSSHFSLAELTASQEAARAGIDNAAPPAVVERLKRTALGLEAVRIRLALPVVVSSGYRCLALNRRLGSADTSAHVAGDAADFICPQFGGPATVVSALIDSGIDFDQLIEEFGRWVHISFDPRNRRQVLRIDAHGTAPWAGGA